MRNHPYLIIIVFTLVILAIDFYTFRGIKKLIVNLKSNIKKTIKILFWIIPVILIGGITFTTTSRKIIDPSEFMVYFQFFSGTFVLFYIPKLIFIFFNFLDDIIHGWSRFFSAKKKQNIENLKSSNKISRSQFLTRIGMITAGIPFLTLAYGIGWGRFDLTVRNVKLEFKNLPKKFNGLRIVQISDFHLGSLLNDSGFVEKIVKKVNSLKPDLFLFTGDFVNNVAGEMDKFLITLNKFEAKLGKYSILGNHDYGEYVHWKSKEEQQANLERLKQIERDLGFDLLLNENRKIKINNEEIELIGVENWGLPPFPQYGDLEKAMKNVNKNSFKILMTHDPTHWDYKVLGYTNIDLTLSGHTHGGQFGIELPGFRWSPVEMRYKRWEGLYTEKEQHLYVNTGVGWIGIPGRVGVPPEITVIELEKV